MTQTQTKKTSARGFWLIPLAASLALSGCTPNTGEITVVSREDGSGTRAAFIELFGIEEKTADGGRKDHTTDEAIIAKQSDVMMTQVAGDEDAIGYLSLGSLNETVKAVSIDGIAPAPEAVASGEYPVARPFLVATAGDPDALAADFIGYILAAEGQTIVNESYTAVVADAAPYASTDPSGTLVVAGSSSVAPVMEKLAEAYEAVNPAAQVDIQLSDSSAGLQAAIDGTADIGMSSRDLKESETATLNATVIARDGIALIVNQANPVTDLTSDQVHAIFTGTVTSWSELTEVDELS
ncbi:MAG: substrate-binding domain-containing protein [Propionibacteriaceae bacterium]|jgi:phosphate transport system substrate-binding protein|nr:substrate-binding domain-containing protein [Propionibacteriaceae bacterium]